MKHLQNYTLEQDNLFRKEVRAMLGQLREGRQYPRSKVLELFGTPHDDNYTEEYMNRVVVKDVTEPFFSRLNGFECTAIFNTKMYKPQVLVNGRFRRDTNNNIIKDEITVPRECVVIKSPVNIRMRSVLDNGDTYTRSLEYDYLYKNSDNDYFYIVPRSKVYKKNKLVLTLSESTRQNHYGEYKITCTDGRPRYLTLLNAGLRTGEIKGVVYVLKDNKSTQPALNAVLDVLLKKGVAMPIKLGGIRTEEGAKKNLFYSYSEPTLDVSEYKELGESIEKLEVSNQE